MQGICIKLTVCAIAKEKEGTRAVCYKPLMHQGSYLSSNLDKSQYSTKAEEATCMGGAALNDVRQMFDQVPPHAISTSLCSGG